MRILTEGGYEADASLIYYGLPTRFAPAVEDTLVHKGFRSGASRPVRHGPCRPKEVGTSQNPIINENTSSFRSCAFLAIVRSTGRRTSGSSWPSATTRPRASSLSPRRSAMAMTPRNNLYWGCDEALPPLFRASCGLEVDGPRGRTQNPRSSNASVFTHKKRHAGSSLPTWGTCGSAIRECTARFFSRCWRATRRSRRTSRWLPTRARRAHGFSPCPENADPPARAQAGRHRALPHERTPRSPHLEKTGARPPLTTSSTHVSRKRITSALDAPAGWTRGEAPAQDPRSRRSSLRAESRASKVGAAQGRCSRCRAEIVLEFPVSFDHSLGQGRREPGGAKRFVISIICQTAVFAVGWLPPSKATLRAGTSKLGRHASGFVVESQMARLSMMQATDVTDCTSPIPALPLFSRVH